ncbi:hypothetical protein ACCD10_01980 [Pseudomonas sp. Pseusp122]|uniref:hypothetical protein n=1 Tax=unclassified Pseudomonas TaxID=196821 RepID=UPI0039A64BE7
MTIVVALAGIPLWANADQSPMLTLITAVGQQVPGATYAHMPGVTLQVGNLQSGYGDGAVGTVQLTSPGRVGSTAVLHGYSGPNRPTDAINALTVTVPALGKQPPSADFQGLLQQELGATARVELLADRCNWNGGLMGDSVDKDTFLKVTLASGEKVFVTALWDRDKHNRPNALYYVFNPDDGLETELKLMDDMECKPGPAHW